MKECLAFGLIVSCAGFAIAFTLSLIVSLFVPEFDVYCGLAAATGTAIPFFLFGVLISRV